VGDLRVGILTCSDSRSGPGVKDDSGRAVIDACEQKGWFVVAYHVCPDDMECIASSIIDMCEAEEADVVLTLGGTGVGPRDVTPEATERICERIVPGVSEAIRRHTSAAEPSQVLSRAVAGIRGDTLIVNLPGGVTPTLDALEFVSGILEAARKTMSGGESD